MEDFLNFKQNKIYDTNNLNFFYINAQSICSLEKFQAFLNLLSAFKIRFEVLIVNETWFIDDFLGKFNLYNIKGYKFFHASRSCNKINKNVGGGIAIYVSDEIVHEKFNASVNKYEKLSLKLRINNEWLKLISYYRPPNHANLSDFLTDLENELNEDEKEQKLIIGDFNINTLENSASSNNLQLLINSSNAIFLNKLVTRSKSNSLIDHVIAQNIDKEILCHTIECPNFSDHNAILVSLDIKKERIAPKIYKKKFIDHQKLNATFKLDEDFFATLTDPNEQLNFLLSEIENAVAKVTTTKKFKIRHPSIADSWLSVKVLELMKQKDIKCAKRRKRKKNNLPYDELSHEIKNLNKKIRKAKIIAYKEHFNNVIKNGDTKTLWNEINSCIGTKKSKQEIIIKRDNNEYRDAEAGKILNDFFVNVGEQLVPSAEISIDLINKFNTLPCVNNSFFLEPTTCDEVFNEIRLLNKNKSAGPDNINTAIIKSINETLTPFLTSIINNMFVTGIYPDALKEGIITAIPKISNATNENDYRPITVLRNISKPIEKIIHSRLEKFLCKTGVMDKNQFGFEKNSSTETPIMELHHRALSALNNNKKLGVVVLDLSKAFDCIPHDILLHKMEYYGIRGLPLTLFESFFTNRTQSVKIGKSKSEFSTVKRGIAQGGIFSPLVFNLGLNDFKNLKLRADTSLRFADDTILIYEFLDEKEFEQNVAHDMKITLEFFKLNGMCLNVKKSSFMIFHKKKCDHLPNKIKINEDNILNRVSTCKYLGITFDEHLSFKYHLEGLKAKLISTVNILSKLKWYLPKFILRLIYFAHFHSHLYYVPFVWGFATESLIKPIQTLQNRALKHIFKLPVLYHTEDLFNGPAKGILPLKGIVAQMTLNFVHKVLNNKIKTNFSFELNTNKTKQNGQIKRLRGKPPDTFGKRDIFNVAPIMYNSIPKEIKCARFGLFKIKLKQYLETFSKQLLNLSQFSLLNLKKNNTNN